VPMRNSIPMLELYGVYPDSESCMIVSVARSVEQLLTLRVCLHCVTVYYNNRLWSTSGRVEQGRMTLHSKARALAYHPTGTVIAVALMTGAVLIVQSDLKAGTSPLQTLTDSKEWSQCIKYVFVVVALYSCDCCFLRHAQHCSTAMLLLQSAAAVA
jgi:hypothetical protein